MFFSPFKIPCNLGTTTPCSCTRCVETPATHSMLNQLYLVPCHSVCIIHLHPRFLYSLQPIDFPSCRDFFCHSHPVRSEPQGPSLWLSYRHHRRPWRAQTASSSQRCTGERRFSATTPPSWQAAATPTGRGGTEQERWVNCMMRVHEVHSHRRWRMSPIMEDRKGFFAVSERAHESNCTQLLCLIKRS